MGLIGRRCTAAMPSRPVLIGRGLVTTQQNPKPTTSHTQRERPRPHAKLRPQTPPTHTRECVRAGSRSHRVTAAIATGKHPDPSRTRKLSLPAPMVLQPRGCGRVGRRRTHTTPERGHPTVASLGHLPRLSRARCAGWREAARHDPRRLCRDSSRVRLRAPFSTGCQLSLGLSRSSGDAGGRR